MLTEQMKKDLANPSDVIEVITSNDAQIRAVLDIDQYMLATSRLGFQGFKPDWWYFNAKALRETAAVFNALADTLDKQNGGANG